MERNRPADWSYQKHEHQNGHGATHRKRRERWGNGHRNKAQWEKRQWDNGQWDESHSDRQVQELRAMVRTLSEKLSECEENIIGLRAAEISRDLRIHELESELKAVTKELKGVKHRSGHETYDPELPGYEEPNTAPHRMHRFAKEEWPSYICPGYLDGSCTTEHKQCSRIHKKFKPGELENELKAMCDKQSITASKFFSQIVSFGASGECESTHLQTTILALQERLHWVMGWK